MLISALDLRITQSVSDQKQEKIKKALVIIFNNWYQSFILMGVLEMRIM